MIPNIQGLKHDELRSVHLKIKANTRHLRANNTRHVVGRTKIEIFDEQALKNNDKQNTMRLP